MSIESDNNLTTLANRIPVTVLSGFLGSGKTTLLNQLLNNLSGMKVAIIVNDMSHINIDADDLKQNVNLHYGQDELVEMSNGCICCTLRADLLQQVSLLARKQQFDYLLIESTGISEPMPVAETFAFLDQNGFSLSEVARLDTMVTVVNGQTFLDLFNSKEEIETEVDGVATTKKLSDLLIEQVEYANTLLISHIDVITDEDYLQLKQLLHTLNPAAEILPMKNGEIAPEVILNTEKFDLETLVNSPSWMKQMDTKNITSESDTYGFSTWAYHKRLPFHPNRLLAFLTKTWVNGTLYRCKGYFWVANNVEKTYAITQSAGEFKCGIVGQWWRFISPSDWPEDDYRKNAILEKWDEFAGDCRQEIVFIGRNIDWYQLEKALDECLLTLEEIQLGPLAWNAFEGVNAFHDFCIKSA